MKMIHFKISILLIMPLLAGEERNNDSIAHLASKIKKSNVQFALICPTVYPDKAGLNKLSIVGYGELDKDECDLLLKLLSKENSMELSLESHKIKPLNVVFMSKDKVYNAMIFWFHEDGSVYVRTTDFDAVKIINPEIAKIIKKSFIEFK